MVDWVYEAVLYPKYCKSETRYLIV